MILGPAGAGKTSVANEIARRTGLPVVHLDLLFWRAGWQPAPRDESLRDLVAAIERPQWILDGNFLAAGEQDPRFERADSVVFLDIGRVRCIWRVLSRVARDRGRSRADLPEGCREGLDWPLVSWIWRYQAVDRPQVLLLLDRLGKRGLDVQHLRSSADVRRFLGTL